MIAPTVGRVVWFYPHGSDLHASPLAAIVTAVWTPTRVNLVVFGANGVPLPTPPDSVLFVQEDNQRPDSGRCYCTWPKREEVAGPKAKVESMVDLAEVLPLAASGDGGGEVGDRGTVEGGAVEERALPVMDSAPVVDAPASPVAAEVEAAEAEADTEVEAS